MEFLFGMLSGGAITFFGLMVLVALGEDKDDI